jgi:hypothetical protein
MVQIHMQFPGQRRACKTPANLRGNMGEALL